MPPEVARQLRSASIDAVAARDLGALGGDDQGHLQRATRAGRVLCTHDQDFLRLAADARTHAGIVFMPQASASVGAWVRALRSLHARFAGDELENRVVFLSGRAE